MNYLSRSAVLLGLVCTLIPATVRGEGVVTIEDFESYSTGVGAWVSSSNGIAVNLSLGLTDAITGNRDLRQTLGANLLGGSYRIENMDLDVAVPQSATHLQLNYRSLLGLNVSKTITITLFDENDVAHVAAPIPLQLLEVGSTREYTVLLANLTPPANGAAISKITGLRMDFAATTAIAAMESIDDIRLTWDNSSVSDWSCY